MVEKEDMKKQSRFWEIIYYLDTNELLIRI